MIDLILSRWRDKSYWKKSCQRLSLCHNTRRDQEKDTRWLLSLSLYHQWRYKVVFKRRPRSQTSQLSSNSFLINSNHIRLMKYACLYQIWIKSSLIWFLTHNPTISSTPTELSYYLYELARIINAPAFTHHSPLQLLTLHISHIFWLSGFPICINKTKSLSVKVKFLKHELIYVRARFNLSSPLGKRRAIGENYMRVSICIF